MRNGCTGQNPSSLPSVTGPSSHCVLLKNMFSASEQSGDTWFAEIREDVMPECSKFGAIRHFFVDKDSQGHIFIMFADVSAGEAAVKALNGGFLLVNLLQLSMSSRTST